MHIEIGDKYVITADKYQFIVNQKMQFGNESKHSGQTYLKQIAFCPTLGQVATVLTMHEVRTSDVKSLMDLQKQIDGFERQVNDSIARNAKEPISEEVDNG